MGRWIYTGDVPRYQAEPPRTPEERNAWLEECAKLWESGICCKPETGTEIAAYVRGLKT